MNVYVAINAKMGQYRKTGYIYSFFWGPNVSIIEGWDWEIRNSHSQQEGVSAAFHIS